MTRPIYYNAFLCYAAGMFNWDPPKEIFTLPIIERPLVWYGVLFALGFWLGYQILFWIYKKTLPNAVCSEDVTHWEGIISHLQNGRMPDVWQALDPVMQRRMRNWSRGQEIDSRWKKILLPLLDRPALERSGFIRSNKAKAKIFCERLSIHVIVGAVLGARLGHLLFYEQLSDLIKDPLLVFRVWEGGLASHGGIAGIFISLVLFAKRSGMRFLQLVDWLVLPACFAAFFIRIGNFINQEILGTLTNLPWAVVFGHPADGSMPAPRHPVQLYEALAYLAIGLILLGVKKRGAWFFTVAFGFRFFIEFLKEKQSVLVGSDALLNMGQWLSLPLILFGIVWLIYGQRGAQRRTVARTF